MQKNKTNDVIFLRNLESNLIEEAIVILKENIKLDSIENEKNDRKLTNNNILKEAELIINQKINQSNVKYEKFKVNKLEKKIKRLKIINIIAVITGILAIVVR